MAAPGMDIEMDYQDLGKISNNIRASVRVDFFHVLLTKARECCVGTQSSYSGWFQMVLRHCNISPFINLYKISKHKTQRKTKMSRGNVTDTLVHCLTLEFNLV